MPRWNVWNGVHNFSLIRIVQVTVRRHNGHSRFSNKKIHRIDKKIIIMAFRIFVRINADVVVVQESKKLVFWILFNFFKGRAEFFSLWFFLGRESSVSQCGRD
jgi:hypothetical protein